MQICRCRSSSPTSGGSVARATARVAQGGVTPTSPCASLHSALPPIVSGYAKASPDCVFNPPKPRRRRIVGDKELQLSLFHHRDLPPAFRLSRPKQCINRFKHTVGILVDVFVPHPVHAPAEFSQIGVASPIVCAFLVCRMRAAIDFDDELRDQTRKVGDVGANGVLAAESVTGDLIAPQSRPKDCLRAS